TDEVIEEVLTATAEREPAVRGITLARLKREGSLPLTIPQEPPFAGGVFPTPSGKVELYCEALAADGADPLPGHFRPRHDYDGTPPNLDPADALDLVSGAAHHFVSSSLASQLGLLKSEGPPFVEINPADAAARGVEYGDEVVLENARGWVRLKA